VETAQSFEYRSSQPFLLNNGADGEADIAFGHGLACDGFLPAAQSVMALLWRQADIPTGRIAE
jgi:hypothetical protein